jgi:hypothetical protein
MLRCEEWFYREREREREREVFEFEREMKFERECFSFGFRSDPRESRSNGYDWLRR